MARKKSTKQWLQRHSDDSYVKKAQQNNYRSRASFKLLEINDRDRLFKPGMTVVDLGAAPGGWSQVVAEKIAPGGRIIAVDLLDFDAIAGVDRLIGDINDPEIRRNLLELLNNQLADLVICDMAPNITGIRATDEARVLDLAQTAIEVAAEVIKPGGALLIKLFQSPDVDAIRAELKQSYRRVEIRKPKASKAQSRELYLMARDYYE